MEEKFKRIESKKELFLEISIATGTPFNTIKSHWFNPCRVPKAHTDKVDAILDKRIDYQEAVKKLHTKYFGK